MSQKKRICFRIAKTSEDKKRIQAFRRECYVEMGRNDLVEMDTRDAEKQELLDDRLKLLEARSGDQTIGTLRWGPYRDVQGKDDFTDRIVSNRTGIPSVPPGYFSRTDRLLIHRDFRSRFILMRLATFCLPRALAAGVRYDICWSEGFLTRIYSRMGYQTIPQKLKNRCLSTMYPQILTIADFARKFQRKKNPVT